ncbi:MAG: tRNA (adenosine(37)-N6)-threonylcarbamoyltransferase complex dimerization subunit type 1 TsaB [Bacteroidetes bacterium]|nr:tRNA (adenosine(37)-N6)-threonylcarbamoyltransferase complex dimerization subunit type 1 TsaB [Bacteroidota bacterium]MBS1972920.1 tRNA (adenosine(37)-N6)-threonylcarbamoyltransferase complex dimerization subunit type 1 TsaB [Bacteroidota bacterium]
MALILNIDTATESASICLSKDGKVLSLHENKNQKDHASWLHVAIDDMMKLNGCSVKDLDAIAVIDGPGSYTGLRVGMSAAKGFCFALNIPLITESTLKTMAYAATVQIKDTGPSLLCPMIDARRMEVFTALYTCGLKELMPPIAMILNDQSFSGHLKSAEIYFFGSGSAKWKNIAMLPNIRFAEVPYNAAHLSVLAYEKFIIGQFADTISSQPAYIKDFHFYIKK